MCKHTCSVFVHHGLKFMKNTKRCLSTKSFRSSGCVLAFPSNFRVANVRSEQISCTDVTFPALACLAILSILYHLTSPVTTVLIYCLYFIFKGLRLHGRNWMEISQMVKTKTEAQCKNFYFNYKRKLDLENVIAEHKASKVRKLIVFN